MHRVVISPSARVCARLGKADRRREGGQALVEFGLVALMLAVLAMALFDLGRAFDAQVSVTQAARDGARAGMSPAIKDNAARSSAASNAALAVRPGVSVAVSGCSSDTFTVTVSFTQPAVTPFFGNFTISRSMTSRCSNV